jgi:hypothetical protein
MLLEQQRSLRVKLSGHIVHDQRRHLVTGVSRPGASVPRWSSIAHGRGASQDGEYPRCTASLPRR